MLGAVANASLCAKRVLKCLQVTLGDVVNAVKHLVTLKNPQVQPHAVLQWLTREFDVDMPRVRQPSTCIIELIMSIA